MRLLPLLFACTSLVAQDPKSPVQAADGLWLVAPKPAGRSLSTTRSFSQGLTIDSQLNVWAVLCEFQPGNANQRDVWLYRSADGGKSWQRVTKAPGKWNAYGAIAGEPNSQILHVAWAAKVDGQAFSSAVYQRFDSGQGVWLGKPEILQKGSGGEDQFSVSDLAVDASGVVTVLVATHRHPKQPTWKKGWSSGIMMRQPGKAKWSGPFPVNTNFCGVWANLQLRDGRAHSSYRSSPGRSIIGYRSFSLATQKYDQASDVEVSVKQNTGRHVANASSLLVGPFGDRTILYPAAAHGGRPRDNGQLLIAFAADDDKWQTHVLCDDPKLRVGNVSHEHFALVQGPGPQVIALYSKVSEGFQVLYRRILEKGKPMEPERVVARSDQYGAYFRIVSVRDSRFRTGMWAVVTGTKAGESLGVRAVLAPRPPKTRWQ